MNGWLFRQSNTTKTARKNTFHTADLNFRRLERNFPINAYKPSKHTSRTHMKTIVKTLPIKVESPNVREHWSKTYKRNKVHAAIIKFLFRELQDVTMPCKITFVRIGVKPLDDDNLVFSCKGIRDSCVAIITGKRRGIGDDDPGFTYAYLQEKGEPSLRIEVSYV